MIIDDYEPKNRRKFWKSNLGIRGQASGRRKPWGLGAKPPAAEENLQFW